MHSCDVCGKTGFRDDALVQFEGKGICPECKDGFFQRLREGVGLKTIGLIRRMLVITLHLTWSVLANYLIVGVTLVSCWVLGNDNKINDGSPTGNALVSALYSVVLFVVIGGSLGAAILTVRCAARQMKIKLIQSPDLFMPPLFIILGVTGLPSAMLCGSLVIVMGLGIFLGLLLAPYFLTLFFALVYLFWLNWKADRAMEALKG